LKIEDCRLSVEGGRSVIGAADRAPGQNLASFQLPSHSHGETVDSMDGVGVGTALAGRNGAGVAAGMTTVRAARFCVTGAAVAGMESTCPTRM
jgi:hypothetical protein